MASSLASKLQLKPHHSLALMNPPSGYAESLASLPVRAIDDDIDEPDAVLLFVTTRAQLLELAPRCFGRVKAGGLAWIAYPKAGSGVGTNINRDSLADALSASGWRPVRQVAIDETWSAIRFRPESDVGVASHRKMRPSTEEGVLMTARSDSGDSNRVSIENVNVPGWASTVDASMYDAMRAALMAVLPPDAPGLSQTEMREAVVARLPEALFPGGAKAGWWAKAVRLDLEAKGAIVREHSKPLRWHRA